MVSPRRTSSGIEPHCVFLVGRLSHVQHAGVDARAIGKYSYMGYTTNASGWSLLRNRDSVGVGALDGIRLIVCLILSYGHLPASRLVFDRL